MGTPLLAVDIRPALGIMRELSEAFDTSPSVVRRFMLIILSYKLVLVLSVSATLLILKVAVGPFRAN